MRTFIENYLHFIKNCIRPPYKKLKSLKSGFIENSNFENNRDPCHRAFLARSTPAISDSYIWIEKNAICSRSSHSNQNPKSMLIIEIDMTTNKKIQK